MAWRAANPETWHDAFAHGATARQDNARVMAIEKKKRRMIAACRADIFECEHQAALALHATEAAAAAQDAVKVFKAHKRAGKFAWQAAQAKNKLWQLGYEREASRIWPHRKREVLQAVANAHGYWGSEQRRSGGRCTSRAYTAPCWAKLLVFVPRPYHWYLMP